MESNIVKSGIVITPSSFGIVVNCTRKNMSRDQSSLVKKNYRDSLRIPEKPLELRMVFRIA